MEKTTKERLVTIETEQSHIKGDLNDIKTNHLPHIQEGVDKNTDKIDCLKYWIMGALLMGVLTLLAALINLYVN